MGSQTLSIYVLEGVDDRRFGPPDDEAHGPLVGHGFGPSPAVTWSLLSGVALLTLTLFLARPRRER